MVFKNKGFIDSLNILLTIDDLNNKDIVCLLNDIPEKFYDEIEKIMDLYEKNNYTYSQTVFFETDKNERYSFKLDAKESLIRFRKESKNKTNSIVTEDIILKNNDYNNILNDCYDSVLIGSYYYSIIKDGKDHFVLSTCNLAKTKSQILGALTIKNYKSNKNKLYIKNLDLNEVLKSEKNIVRKKDINYN